MSLQSIKLVHTVIWAFFAACILAIPVLTWRRRFRGAAVVSAIVAVECLILLLNGMRCPLTDMAAPLTRDRADNFDIYLPVWLARYNKLIFGTLYAVGLLVLGVTWARARRHRSGG